MVIKMLIKSQSPQKQSMKLLLILKLSQGLAILKLVQEGRLNLNDDVSKHVPHFKMNYKWSK